MQCTNVLLAPASLRATLLLGGMRSQHRRWQQSACSPKVEQRSRRYFTLSQQTVVVELSPASWLQLLLPPSAFCCSFLGHYLAISVCCTAPEPNFGCSGYARRPHKRNNETPNCPLAIDLCAARRAQRIAWDCSINELRKIEIVSCAGFERVPVVSCPSQPHGRRRATSGRKCARGASTRRELFCPY